MASTTDKEAHTAVQEAEENQPVYPHTKTRNWKKIVAILVAVMLAIIALAVGLGVGLTRGSDTGSASGSGSGTSPDTSSPAVTVNSTGSPSSSTSSNDKCPYSNLATIGGTLTTPTSSNSWWKPSAGTTWQIILSPDSDQPKLTYDYEVYDLDLFDVPASTFADLHSRGKKVMCYFSAGSAEDWRSDYGCFSDADRGAGLAGWAGENWLVTNSSNVRAVMLARLDLAVQKGCDGVDPDNVDGYDNSENRLGLTEEDAVDYIRFLADAAHARNLAVGLKNAGSIAETVLDSVEWEVNEECIELEECAQFDVFIKAGKPVFNIEYPPEDHIDNDWTQDEEVARCGLYADAATGASGFSTVLKKHIVDEWIKTCPLS
ncbi:hypothetical protein FH972_021652 [Carpinus fangiana]|uniref:Glycoside-hydrolase family GH114 TIM-barrel domain-containing protein n=1 Tax=Carpinus fangiana TaxID=176857 RepID=A0A5N6KQA8_9ROSI|nr:hypothetical protein FH972_021652 [Carpinus fangiana]